jgi:hypothetical protein
LLLQHQLSEGQLCGAWSVVEGTGGTVQQQQQQQQQQKPSICIKAASGSLQQHALAGVASSCVPSACTAKLLLLRVPAWHCAAVMLCCYVAGPTNATLIGVLSEAQFAK